MTVTAFAPGRVNLIGEHTDYNDGLALPFAIERGITVTATDDVGSAPPDSPYVRGVMAELGIDGGVRVGIESDLPRGVGVSSSAALTLALALALGADDRDPLALARLGQRVEHAAGAQTGLLDQLAILTGREGCAVRIDFRTPAWTYVPVNLRGWRLALLHSGAEHAHAESGYNERRAECRAAAERLGLESLRDLTLAQLTPLAEPLRQRARHVVEENARVDAAVDALDRGDLDALASLIDASHASLRDLYDASVPEVEETVARAKAAGAAGARMMGGGFGGAVLALFPPGVDLPYGALAVSPSAGARRRAPSGRASA